jgi:hypothetical protein
LQPWLHHAYADVVARSEWVLLAYRLPREPSTPRINVWRKLRRLGAVQVVDGLVALPADPRTVEAFDWLADEVLEAGGEAWTWRATSSKQQDRALRQRAADAVAAEFRSLATKASDAEADPQRRTADRLRRELRSIQGRDYFGSKEQDRARRAVEHLAALLDAEAEAAR